VSQAHLGRIVGGKIVLDDEVDALEGQRVRVTVEVVEDEHPAVRAAREAPPDDRPYTDAERAGVEAARKNGEYVTTAELRERLAAERAKER
jgi:hypothetical protein